MRFTGIKLIVATDDRREGLDRTLGCTLAECPSWCLVTSDPAVILNIPRDIPAYGIWFSTVATPAKTAWEERRAAGWVAGIDAAMLQRLADWNERREAEERRLAYGDVLTLSPPCGFAADGAPDAICETGRPAVAGSAPPEGAQDRSTAEGGKADGPSRSVSRPVRSEAAGDSARTSQGRTTR